jgi:hypothetical protein
VRVGPAVRREGGDWREGCRIASPSDSHERRRKAEPWKMKIALRRGGSPVLGSESWKRG